MLARKIKNCPNYHGVVEFVNDFVMDFFTEERRWFMREVNRTTTDLIFISLVRCIHIVF